MARQLGGGKRDLILNEKGQKTLPHLALGVMKFYQAIEESTSV